MFCIDLKKNDDRSHQKLFSFSVRKQNKIECLLMSKYNVEKAFVSELIIEVHVQ